jgi:hypothetical protein
MEENIGKQKSGFPLRGRDPSNRIGAKPDLSKLPLKKLSRNT